jgi:hypothetical protein
VHSTRLGRCSTTAVPVMTLLFERSTQSAVHPAWSLSRVPAFHCAGGATAALLERMQRRLSHTRSRVLASRCARDANAALLERRQRRLGSTLSRVPTCRCARGVNAATPERRQRRPSHTLSRVPATAVHLYHEGAPATRLLLPRAIAADMRLP